MKKLIKIAVIGAGKLGSRHAETYSNMPGVDLVGVCDSIESRAQDTAKLCRTRAYTDYRQLLQSVDAASIVVPSEFHFKVSSDFLKNGVHLLIEKPITTKLSDANKLLSLAKIHKAIIQVGHIERFNSAIRTVKSVINKPRFIECHRLGPYSPRVANTGVVLDLMIHDIDIVLDLIKSPIKHVDAAGAFMFSKTEDLANARIRFANNSVCALTASRVVPGVMRKIRIFQDNAYISLDYVKQEVFIHKKVNGTFHSKKINILKKDALGAELSDFIECVRLGRSPIVSGEEARDALALALLITNQIKNKKNSIKY